MEEKLTLVAVYAIPLLFAITMHEVAHGYAARQCGDRTAARLGRLSLNPLRHIDIFGTIILPLVLYLSPLHLPFGYAKPVPVNYNRLKHPRSQMVIVAMAGPLANFAMGLVWGFLWLLLLRLGVHERHLLPMAEAGLFVNAMMFVFNLIPFPPLDGSRLLEALLPARVGKLLVRLEMQRGYPLIFFAILIGLMHFHVLDRPLLAAVQAVGRLVLFLVSPLV